MRVVTERGSPLVIDYPRSAPADLSWLKSQLETNRKVLTDSIRKEVKILNLTTNKRHPGSGSFDSREAMLYNRHTPKGRIFLHVNN